MGGRGKAFCAQQIGCRGRIGRDGAQWFFCMAQASKSGVRVGQPTLEGPWRNQPTCSEPTTYSTRGHSNLIHPPAPHPSGPPTTASWRPAATTTRSWCGTPPTARRRRCGSPTTRRRSRRSRGGLDKEPGSVGFGRRPLLCVQNGSDNLHAANDSTGNTSKPKPNPNRPGPRTSTASWPAAAAPPTAASASGTRPPARPSAASTRAARSATWRGPKTSTRSFRRTATARTRWSCGSTRR